MNVQSQRNHCTPPRSALLLLCTLVLQHCCTLHTCHHHHHYHKQFFFIFLSSPLRLPLLHKLLLAPFFLFPSFFVPSLYDCFVINNNNNQPNHNIVEKGEGKREKNVGENFASERKKSTLRESLGKKKRERERHKQWLVITECSTAAAGWSNGLPPSI